LLLPVPWPLPPLLQKHCQDDSVGPIIELCNEDNIRYIAPLEENKGFFVPEVAMEAETKKER